MSFVPEHQRRLIIDTTLGKVSKEDFYREYPVRAEEAGRLSVEMLRAAYREYDDADSLGVKAIWALGRLQTEEAVDRLADLATCGRPILEKNAREQLARIVSRSESEALREVARERLEGLEKRDT